MRGRKETELAHYFKLEYGAAEVDRLLAEARAARRSSPGRIWAGLRQRLAGWRRNGRRGSGNLGHQTDARLPAVPSAPASSDASAPAKDLIPPELPVDCLHLEWEALGSGGNTTYLQCKACGALVVSQGDRLWSFGRGRPEGI